MVSYVLLSTCFQPRGRQLYFCLTIGLTVKVSGLKVINWATGFIIIVSPTHMILDPRLSEEEAFFIVPYHLCSSVLDISLFDLAYFEHYSTFEYLLQKMDFLILILLFSNRTFDLLFFFLSCELFSFRSIIKKNIKSLRTSVHL